MHKRLNLAVRLSVRTKYEKEMAHTGSVVHSSAVDLQ